MPNSTVSVLMTAFNREKYIASSIESVLSSTYSDFELIVVDDASSDHTVEIAREYESKDHRVKVFVNETNLGDYPNRNKAASLATGKYIKYLDSDDLIYSHGLAVFIQSMEQNPTAILGMTSRNALPQLPFPHLLNPRNAYLRHFFGSGLLDFGPSGVIIRRDVFMAVGCFSGKRFVGDQECWMKIAASHPVLELAPSLIYWRRHEGQEYQIGTAGIDGGYFLMTIPMLREAFASSDCPLNEKEKSNILKIQYRSTARTLLKYLLKTGNISKVLQRKKQLMVPVTAIF